MKKRKKKSNIYNVKTSILRPLNECHVFNFGARTLDWAQLPSHAEGSLSNSIVYISHVTERKGVVGIIRIDSRLKTKRENKLKPEPD